MILKSVKRPQELTISDELAALELNEKTLTDALFKAFSSVQNEPSTVPKNYPGIAMWARLASALTEGLGVMGWESRPRKNSPHFYSPSGKYCLLIFSGDERTGVEDVTASNKAPKGPVVQEACLMNQSDLFGLEADSLPQDVRSDVEHLVLMYRIDKADLANPVIYAEVSKPINYEKGFVTSWETKIILPAISLNSFSSESTQHTEKQEEIDIPVGRKKT